MLDVVQRLEHWSKMYDMAVKRVGPCRVTDNYGGLALLSSAAKDAALEIKKLRAELAKQAKPD